MRPVPQIGLDLIASYEQDRLHVYQDIAGVWTIGRGAIFDPEGNRCTAATPPITQEQLLAMFDRDVGRECAPIEPLCGPHLTDNEYAALACFCFNLGVAHFRSSALRSAVQRGDMAYAADQLLRWCYAGGIRSRGLLNRRASERKLFLHPDDAPVDVAFLRALRPSDMVA